MTDSPLGRACPDCGEPMTNLPSHNARQCATGCKETFDWHLAPGQQPLVDPSRADRRPQQ